MNAWLSAAAALVLAGAAGADTLVLRAGVLHTGNGRVVERGTVVIVDGKIVAVGASLDAPAGATVIEAPEGSLTPGLIDANAALERVDVFARGARDGGGRPGAEPVLGRVIDPFRAVHDHADAFTGTDAEGHVRGHLGCCGVMPCVLEERHAPIAAEGKNCPFCGWPGVSSEGGSASGLVPGAPMTEGASEVVPHTRVLDSIDLRSADLERLAAGGVTAVFAASEPSAVIGPRGAVLRTAGPIGARVIRAEDAVTAAMGRDPIDLGPRNMTPNTRIVSVRTRRPTTRMGVTWVFRKAFYDAERHAAGLEVTGSDAPSIPALEVLRQVREGKVPLRIVARHSYDIESAVRLAGEFGLAFTLVDAAEAYKCIDLIRGAGLSVVYGPIDERARGRRAQGGDDPDLRLSTIRELVAAGVPVSLSAQDLRDEDGLARQAMYAVRAGLPADAALRAVTAEPARLLGLAEHGVLEPGKRGDVVLWSGSPFGATSRPLVVVIEGRVVVDRRSSGRE